MFSEKQEQFSQICLSWKCIHSQLIFFLIHMELSSQYRIFSDNHFYSLNKKDGKILEAVTEIKYPLNQAQ